MKDFENALRALQEALKVLQDALEDIWVSLGNSTFASQLWGEPGILCVFDVLKVSRDTQRHLEQLEFLQVQTLFPDVALIF